ncbi:MAG: hypothetical protein EP329_21020 [Deltaproteobacteria bacterium]|nr:MAG: hypothetical protein EP329_21020 [Deltaproteobacteria bacterium]
MDDVSDADADADAGSADADADDAADTGPGDVDVTLDPDGVATVTAGAEDRLLLVGVVLTPEVAFDGEVLVAGEDIACVAPGTGCSDTPEAEGATVIDTAGAVIAPGLIDTHNHILFDIFNDDDWLPSKVYTNHTQWTQEPRYAAMLDVKQCLADDSQGKPTWCPLAYDGAGSLRCEMDKWGELKGLIAGTTSIVGLPGTSAACFGSLARSVDSPQNGLGGDHIQTSATFPPSQSSGDGVCANFADGDTHAYLVHCGEGTDAKALAEFDKLGALTTEPMCLYAPQTAITHGTAFGPEQFAVMAAHGMKLTWSPASNVALYGETTDIPAALDADVLVTLAPDWSMGGSQNLLDELRFADAWDDAHFGDILGARDLVLMTTGNAAFALALDDRLGGLAPGMLADLAVFRGGGDDPWAVVVGATPASVVLTMVGGRILYGDAALEPAAPPAPGCEPIEVCGVAKFLCVAEPSSANKLDQTYAEIEAALQAGLEDLDAVSGDGFDFAPLAPLVDCE